MGLRRMVESVLDEGSRLVFRGEDYGEWIVTSVLVLVSAMICIFILCCVRIVHRTRGGCAGGGLDEKSGDDTDVKVQVVQMGQFLSGGERVAMVSVPVSDYDKFRMEAVTSGVIVN